MSIGRPVWRRTGPVITSTVCLLVSLVMPAMAGEGEQVLFPLKAGAEGRYLVDQKGEPFLIHGDTPWSLTHNLTFEESSRYIEDRRKRGFNALILSIPDAYAPDGTHPDPPDRSGHFPFADRDLTRPVEPYWSHVDRVIRKCLDAGLLVLFFPAYLGCCEDGYLQLLIENGEAKALAYGHWIGARYRHFPNLIWVHGGDREAEDVLPLVGAIQRGIAESSPDQLHTVHWAPEIDPWTHLGEEGIDLYSTYTYGSVAAKVRSHYDHRPVKPVFLIETHYENDFGKRTAEDTRKYPYRAVLAGAAGHFFGNRPLWFCGHGWEPELDSPGSRSIQIAGEFFRSIPWHRLVPDREHRFVTEGYGDSLADDGVQAAVTDDGRLGVAYLPSARPLRIDPAVLTGKELPVRWFDPRAGTWREGGAVAAGSSRELHPPEVGDWVLVVGTWELGTF